MSIRVPQTARPPVPLPRLWLAMSSFAGRSQSQPQPRPPSFLGLLLHDVTMAGLQELRFPEEKPLLRGQDATELVSCPLAILGAGAPPRGGRGNSVHSLRS